MSDELLRAELVRARKLFRDVKDWLHGHCIGCGGCPTGVDGERRTGRDDFPDCCDLESAVRDFLFDTRDTKP